MEYVLEERIGNPDLFVGRKEELAYFLKWIDDIKEKKSKSTALLARRKMGKSAIMERLFNITFFRNEGVIPFYYEVKESKKWIVDFCEDFFLTFIYQYIAFKSRKQEYLNPMLDINFENAKGIAKSEGLEYLIDFIERAEYAAANESIDNLWQMVRDAPRAVAAARKEFVLQMIDEFQFLNSKIYWDKAKTNLADDMAAGYLSTAESKVAPLLVSGSWVGWLMNLLTMMLPARFKFRPLNNLPPDEAIEMIFKYSRFFNVPVSEEMAYVIAEMSDGSPFYINAVFQSDYENKDLTHMERFVRLMEFETLDNRGDIKRTWMEYVTSAFHRINDVNAKKIVLYLSKHREREVTRKELLEKLQLDMTDDELEKRLKALVKADIINQGQSYFRYQGVKDDIFDKVFRGVYQEEIESFSVEEITKEYVQSVEQLKKNYHKLQGKYNYQKGFIKEVESFFKTENNAASQY